MERHLRLQPGQQELTPEQEAEARCFAAERIAAQLSTEPVDERDAEAFLRQAYDVAGRAAPQQMHWLGGPLQLVEEAPQYLRDNPGNHLRVSVRTSLWNNVRANVERSLWEHACTIVEANVGAGTWGIRRCLLQSISASTRDHVLADYRSVQASVRAYEDAAELALYHFFDRYLFPNDAHALAHFTDLVSGYWLIRDGAFIVHRPLLLARDEAGRLHSETGKCVEYRDGWGFYAWHGVLVPEKAILAPEQLTREDFLNEPNLEVRRVIWERMGNRFVSELGDVIESGPRGVLYEVVLFSGPERRARYVQVQDASTGRQYFLRVPPTIQTAAEAVAWSFHLAVEEYSPAQET
ncbi:MAG: hypothetical protein JO215_10810 [Ktedonobacteraceae bacterium]|nr:hypothetical protein [Ktedonobacteraceae bacterium]